MNYPSLFNQLLLVNTNEYQNTKNIYISPQLLMNLKMKPNVQPIDKPT